MRTLNVQTTKHNSVLHNSSCTKKKKEKEINRTEVSFYIWARCGVTDFNFRFQELEKMLRYFKHLKPNYKAILFLKRSVLYVGREWGGRMESETPEILEKMPRFLFF